MNLPELPVINRARGFYLYDDTGRRYLDFFQDDGRAVLGHRPAGLSTHLKNVLSKGLLAESRSKYPYRLKKALGKLFPEHPYVRIYQHWLQLEAVLRQAGAVPANTPIPDILTAGDAARETVLVWRPFLEDEGRLPEILAPLLPFPGGFAPAVLCFREKPGTSFPRDDICSPLLLAGLTRIVYDLLREIGQRARDSWMQFAKPGWLRRGPYLLPQTGEAEYCTIVQAGLQQGILLNPSRSGPSIIPPQYSPGELDSFLRRC